MEYVRAFAVGGAICVVGQLLIDLTKLTPARIMVAYVTGGVILGALGWYAPLVNFAGCGATVPLSGFGYLLSEGVKAAVKEKGILGVFTGGITAGAAGIAAVLCGTGSKSHADKHCRKNFRILIFRNEDFIFLVCV